MQDEWNSPDNPPGTTVLVTHIKPFFGEFVAELRIAYYDNPVDYENPEEAEGWKCSATGHKLWVTAWKPLCDKADTEYDGMDQQDYIEKKGKRRPEMGACLPLQLKG